MKKIAINRCRCSCFDINLSQRGLKTRFSVSFKVLVLSRNRTSTLVFGQSGQSFFSLRTCKKRKTRRPVYVGTTCGVFGRCPINGRKINLSSIRVLQSGFLKLVSVSSIDNGKISHTHVAISITVFFSTINILYVQQFDTAAISSPF